MHGLSCVWLCGASLLGLLLLCEIHTGAAASMPNFDKAIEIATNAVNLIHQRYEFYNYGRYQFFLGISNMNE